MSEKLAIITGTSSGIGKALAGRLLMDGWDVLGIARRDVVRGEEAYQHFCFDLGNLAALSNELAPQLTQILNSRPRTKVALINNAAVTGQTRNVNQLDIQTLSNSLAINTVAPVALTGLLTRVCPPETAVRIVNISSGLASQPLAGCTDYCTSKAALLMAGKILSVELESAANSNVAIMSFSPGTVATEMQESLRSQSAESFPASEIFKQFHNQGMLVSPQSVLQPIVSFLDEIKPPAYSETAYSVGQGD